MNYRTNPKIVFTAEELNNLSLEETEELDRSGEEIHVKLDDGSILPLDEVEILYAGNWDIDGFRPIITCPECARSFGPNYDGPCDH